MTVEAGHAGGRRWVNPRVVVLLVVLTAVICGTVIVVDRISPRDRGTNADTTREAPSSGSMPGTASRPVK